MTKKVRRLPVRDLWVRDGQDFGLWPSQLRDGGWWEMPLKAGAYWRRYERGVLVREKWERQVIEHGGVTLNWLLSCAVVSDWKSGIRIYRGDLVACLAYAAGGAA